MPKSHILQVVALGLVLSCGGASEKASAPSFVLTTVAVSLSSTNIQVGQSTFATARGYDQHGGAITLGPVIWTSSATNVATISGDGAIIALASGQTTISAATAGKTGQATLTVSLIPVAAVTVTPATASVLVGQTQQLSASLFDASGSRLSDRAVTWTSSDSAKARVSSEGLVTAVAEGLVSVTVASEGRSATAAITVTLPTAGAEGTAFPVTTASVNYLASDPALAVGQDRIVFISNAEVVIASKAGLVITRKPLHEFFLPAMVAGESSAGDVAAVYDDATGRFFVAEAAKIHPQTCLAGTCVGHNMIAVSKSATPGSLLPTDWHLFAIDRYVERSTNPPILTTIWADFDVLATSPDALIVTSRRYRESDGAPMGAIIRILDKASIVAGRAPTTWTDLAFPNNVDVAPGLMPAHMFDTAPVHFFVGRAPSAVCGVTVWGVTTGAGTPSVTTQVVPLDGTCDFPRYAPQASSTIAMDVGGASSLARSPVFRNGRLWVAQTWGQRFAAGTVTAIKWAELDVSRWPGTPRVVQQGLVGADGVWTFHPAITVDPSGNAVLAFNTTSETSYPSIHASVHRATDAPGVMGPWIMVKAGSSPNLALDSSGRNRFADFLSLDLDPATSGTWVHGQYGATDALRTWAALIKP